MICRLIWTFCLVLSSAEICSLGAACAQEKVVLFAGGAEDAVNIPAVQAKLHEPFGIDFDRTGAAYVVELGGQRVLKIENGLLKLVAGTGKEGKASDVDQPGLQAQFHGMHNLAVGPSGQVFLADTWNQQIRIFDPESGFVKNFAGTGDKAFAGDGGPAAKAKFGGIYCVTLSGDHQRLVLADLDNRRMRAIDLKTSVVTTVAGNGQKGIPADGSVAADSPLVDPRAVAADQEGNVYVLERSGHALRIVNRAGQIRTVIGTGKPGHSGDNGPGKLATLNGPKHLCLDQDGSVIIADTDNHVIRRYLPKEDRIVRIAGTGKKGHNGVGGPPDQLELNQPHGVTIGPNGDLYIVDSQNHRILRIERNNKPIR
ncbi:MAG: repeat protein [Planctomycetaceae bacterium]|nr:repeat protein [Planctomycetaceae bacterium]